MVGEGLAGAGGCRSLGYQEGALVGVCGRERRATALVDSGGSFLELLDRAISAAGACSQDERAVDVVLAAD